MLEKFGFTSTKKKIKNVVLDEQKGDEEEQSRGIKRKKVFSRMHQGSGKMNQTPLNTFSSSDENELKWEGGMEIQETKKGFSRMHQRSVSRKKARFNEFSSRDDSELKWDDCLEMQEINKMAKGTYNKLDIEDITSSEDESDAEELEPPEVTIDQLNQEQRRVLKLLKDGRNVFLTGVGGTGKTVLLKFIQFCSPAGQTFFTASTGLAACAIGGVTLHSFAGIGKGTGPHNIIIDRVMKKKETKKRWRRCNVLIIDEISMISGELFDLIDKIARTVRKNSLPFGGVQLVLSGDFLQLPPVSRLGTASFAFESKAWGQADIEVVELTEVYRQRDESFVKLLYQLRFGVLSSSSLSLLQERLNPSIPDDATMLHARRDGAARDNKRKLDEIEAELYEFTAEDEMTPKNRRFFERLVKQCQAQQKLQLKVGAKVVLLKKINDSLPNGTLGRIVDFQVVGEEGVAYPVVRFGDRRKSQHLIEPVAFEIANGEKKIGKRWQIPLLLGWSLTIHKSQGMTLENVFVQLKDCFEAGQAYVALSRCRYLDKLYIADRRLSMTCFKVNQKAVAFYRSLSTFNPSMLEQKSNFGRPFASKETTPSCRKEISHLVSKKDHVQTFGTPKFQKASAMLTVGDKENNETITNPMKELKPDPEEYVLENKSEVCDFRIPFQKAICNKHGCDFLFESRAKRGAYLLSCTNPSPCVVNAFFENIL